MTRTVTLCARLSKTYATHLRTNMRMTRIVVGLCGHLSKTYATHLGTNMNTTRTVVGLCACLSKTPTKQTRKGTVYITEQVKVCSSDHWLDKLLLLRCSLHRKDRQPDMNGVHNLQVCWDVSVVVTHHKQPGIMLGQVKLQGPLHLPTARPVGVGLAAGRWAHFKAGM